MLKGQRASDLPSLRQGAGTGTTQHHPSLVNGPQGGHRRPGTRVLPACEQSSRAVFFKRQKNMQQPPVRRESQRHRKDKIGHEGVWWGTGISQDVPLQFHKGVESQKGLVCLENDNQLHHQRRRDGEERG